jgi:hypothetical protein
MGNHRSGKAEMKKDCPNRRVTSGTRNEKKVIGKVQVSGGNPGIPTNAENLPPMALELGT